MILTVQTSILLVGMTYHIAMTRLPIKTTLPGDDDTIIVKINCQILQETNKIEERLNDLCNYYSDIYSNTQHTRGNLFHIKLQPWMIK